MKRVLGIAIILAAIMTISAIIQPVFFDPYNIKNILRWTGLFGLLSLGEAFVIMTSGIDLSVGSIVGFIGAMTIFFLKVEGMSVPMVMFIVLLLSIGMGLLHGLLVTKVKLQPFVVTLCGLFVYRGLSRFILQDSTQTYGNQFQVLKFLVEGRFPLSFWPNAPQFITDWSLPMPFVIMVVLGVLLAIFLNRTIYGRYILALGRNESAARFSGINTDRMVILTYIISAVCAGLAGLLFSLDLNSVQPSTAGNMYELYAIAGCVVGGISLKGGEGNILGVVIGVAIVRVLYNAINILGIATQLESAVIGMVILIGVGADEMIKNLHNKKRLSEVKKTENAVSAA
jgi:ribose transport system permease protein